MKQWDKIFEKYGKVFTSRHEDMPKIVKIFKKHHVGKVLDLGFGSGRHVIYLAKHGFEVYGIDISSEGKKITNAWLKSQNLKANLKIGSIYKKLPFEDNFFDAAISTSTIHHERIQNVRKTIAEMERILKPSGLIFITVRKRKFMNFRPKLEIIELFGGKETKYKVIAPRTYLPTEGGEKGLPHYLFNKELIKKEFKNFKILDIWVDSDSRHYCFLGQLKINYVLR